MKHNFEDKSKRNDSYNESTTGSSSAAEASCFLQFGRGSCKEEPVACSVMVAVWLPSSSLQTRGTACEACDIGEVGLLKREGDVKPDVRSDCLV